MSNYDVIYQVVRKIPKGKVATYGQVADLANLPGRARLVGYALYQVDTEVSDVPWHRVINAQGRISFPLDSDGYRRQRERLEAEGVEFIGERINLKVYRWDGLAG